MRSTAFAAVLVCLANMANADLGTLEAQDMLHALGSSDVVPDGEYGPKTASGVAAIIAEQPTTINQSVLNKLYSSFVERNSAVKVLDWDYRSAEIELSGYNEKVYDGLSSLADMSGAGLNVATFAFHCDRGQKMDLSASENYPLERQFGCELAYNFRDGSSRDALIVYIEEAKKNGLKVNLKPTFLDLTSDVSGAGYKYGAVPVEDFLYGNAPHWDGYVPRIYKIAEFAQAHGVEYLTIGTEFGNLNRKIMRSKDWEEIIGGIRQRFKGEIVYSHNYGPDGSLKDLINMEGILDRVDYVGVNFFPTTIRPKNNFYSVEEAEKMLRSAKVDGVNMIEGISEFSQKVSAKIILTEVSFPTWRGSIKWMFRHTCDYDNKGKSGWEFNEGPLSPKTPSVSASLVLASAWYNVFKDMPWADGSSHVFWYRTWADADTNAEYVEKTGARECGLDIDRNTFLRSFLATWYK